ncbi:Holliday junction branch migration protein RuvA [Solitalea koreensis]|uniref:Holliday junction branch migration complex subunit RuvA n=1 Tax=Solitalea koreensis TaxID=543615 RepID=A0A521CRL3_9SPHI|nr:Holliday junction branch migration protein RuvA [Solitalea koreensis]SMO62094.1 Holliday junction DNA helicase subunit RuvA [Solitalea koreensis]
MIAYVQGKLAFKCPTHVIIDTGGVGFHINISLNTYSRIAEPEETGSTALKLYTYLHVKEDAHTLYGFAEEGERRLFTHLLSVSGIGPNTCRMILSSITPQEMEQAIIRGEVGLIQRIKGIGPKSAQRIILELQDKLKKEGPGSLISVPVNNTVKDESLSALVMLGFAKNLAEKVLDKLMKNDNDTNFTVESLIKAALKNL